MEIRSITITMNSGRVLCLEMRKDDYFNICDYVGCYFAGIDVYDSPLVEFKYVVRGEEPGEWYNRSIDININYLESIEERI